MLENIQPSIMLFARWPEGEDDVRVEAIVKPLLFCAAD